MNLFKFIPPSIRFWLVSISLIGTANAQVYPWQGEIRFPGTLFPSFAISAAGKDAKGPIDRPNVFGYLESASFGVLIKGTAQGSIVKVRISVPDLGAEGEIESTPQPTDAARAIFPRMNWNQQRLASIAQPMSSEVIYQVFVDGQQIGEQRKPLRVRAVTDAPLRLCETPGKCSDYSQYFAAFVNEDNPIIDKVLRATLSIPAMPVKSFVGTAGGEEYVLKQVWAIWYFLQRNQVTYSSITTTSDGSTQLISQAVRPISQSLGNGQANCIDGTVLLASILRKIGIEPIIVLVPGHAFLGFYVDQQNSRVAYLETTMINSPSNPFNLKPPTQTGSEIAKFLGMDAHMAKSRRSFDEAIEVGRQKFEQAAPYFDKRLGYSYIRVMKSREAGILPLPL